MAYNDILSLDVGGTRFKTTRQTLLKDPESMLARMFHPDSQIAPAQIQDEAYFLDRCPNMFGIILGYLRSDYLKNLSENTLEELQVEAGYYQLTSLLKIIQQRLVVEEESISNSKDQVNVIVDGQKYKCKPDALQYCDKEMIDQNGDFNVRYGGYSEDIVRRILRRLEDNRVGDVAPPDGTELLDDSIAAIIMRLLSGDSKWFY